MEKEWYILFDQDEEGPFSLADISRDERITPDTWVRHQSAQEWKRARFIKELELVFKDKPLPQALNSPTPPFSPTPDGIIDQEVLVLPQDPFQRLLWVLVLLLLLLSLIYQIFRR